MAVPTAAGIASSPGGEHRGASPLPAPQNGTLRLGRYRPIWASPEVEVSPALKFTVAQQQVELSPEDARRLGISEGDELVVGSNGTRIRGTAHVRTGVPAGTAFAADGIAEDSANALTEPVVEVRKA
jgi:anaerobic selenocysteine-containing dehydrogenase